MQSSSVYNDNNANFGPYFGWIGGSLTSAKPFRSKREENPWLQFHFAKIQVAGIVVTNRKDVAEDRFQDIEVRAGLVSEPLYNEVVGTFVGRGATGGDHYIGFTSIIVSKYITIQVKRRNAQLVINGVKITGRGIIQYLRK